MFKKALFTALFLGSLQNIQLQAHCQMPCGIYHDDMVFDQVDQYIETIVKGISIMLNSKFNTVQERNEFIRWVELKESSSNETANLLTTYFLQQKIKPGEEDTDKRVQSVHKLLFLLVKIKQTADYSAVNDFYQEWEKFKLMFHVEGYECKMEQVKLKEWAKKRDEAAKKAKANHTHSHDDDHDHDHDHDEHDHDHDHTH